MGQLRSRALLPQTMLLHKNLVILRRSCPMLMLGVRQLSKRGVGVS